MIVASDGSDTALARLLLSQAALDVETLRRALGSVRAERDLTGLTLAQVLRTRGLVSPPVLEQALETLSARQSTAGASPHPDLPGHRVLRELARGGMGVVYEIERVSDGARFALKTLLPAGLAIDVDALDEERVRFVREAQALAQLRHPHVVRIHAADLEGRVPYMVQDLLPGGTLADRLRQGPLPWSQAIEITSKLCAGLAYAHARGLLHRDLKPQNVLFDDQGEPRLVDFGLVRSLAGSSLTQTGQLLGTPAYMAPEQAFGHEADLRTDVYGMGAVLYALLTGRPPFEGAGLGILAAVIEDAPPPIRSFEVEVPAWLEAVCLRALEKSPDDRYASLELLQAALQERSESPPKRRRSPWVWLAALAALGALAPIGLQVNAWQAERSRRQAQKRALGELRQALRVSAAAVHSGLPEWSKHWPSEPPPELVLARGLSAIRRRDLPAAEGCARQLGEFSAVQDFRAALMGGIAAASEGPSPRGIKSLRSARKASLLRDLPDLSAWEIELLLRSPRDSDRAEALALLSKRLMADPAARPTAEESRQAHRAVFAYQRPPSDSVLRHMERLLPKLDALQVWRGSEGLESLEWAEKVLAQTPLRAPELAPPFLRARLHRLAKIWQEGLLQLLEPAKAKVGWKSLSARLYERFTLWLQIAARLRLRDEFGDFVKDLLEHAQGITPIRVEVGGGDLKEKDRVDSATAARTQAVFLRELVSTRPRDSSLRTAALLLVTHVAAKTRIHYRPCLTELLKEATPEERPWLHVFDSYLRVAEATSDLDLEACLRELAPYLDQSDFGRRPPPTVTPLTRYDLRALTLWTLAQANTQLERVDAALLRYGELGSLQADQHQTVPHWRHAQLRLEQSKAEELPPGPARDQALRQVALKALGYSKTWRRGAFHLQNLVGIAWELRRTLSLEERRALIEAASPYRRTRFFAWIARRAALLVEIGECKEAARELRFDYSFEGFEEQPTQKFLARARALADQAERAQTPTERASLVRRIQDLITESFFNEQGARDRR